jgi:nucleotide-binding universal stress UspA family protein
MESRTRTPNVGAMFTTIVAGTDALHRGRNAVAFAGALASATGSRLLLVASHEHGPRPRRDILRRLRHLRNELAPGALVLVVPDASPANALRRVAEEQHADLIVVGARHASRVRRMLRGEPGMQILRGAPCAVVVAPDHGRCPERIARMGVGVDATPESASALELATALAAQIGATVEPLSVDDGDDAAERLAELSEHVDLLVLGSRRFGPVRRLALGSTSEQVVRNARGPVLVAPRGPARERVLAAQASAARA